jgi:16S rRNA (cytosine1402-N4)-methyltransferase
MSTSSGTVHLPILAPEIVRWLLEPLRALPAEAPPQWIVDCTLGGGGHTSQFLEALASDPRLSKHRVLSVDQDPSAVERGQQRFSREIAEGRLEIMRSRFGGISSLVASRPVLGLMADLGFSSDQIEDQERGLSFRSEGPLDMRLDPTQGQSARDFLLRSREEEIARVLFEYGEERFSRRIASRIVEARRSGDLPSTAKGLADLIEKAVPPPARHGRIHPATRSFQALRIQVNQELEELDSLLHSVILGVAPGGRVAILSFHSLEDRMVKLAFKTKEGPFRALTKKPIEPDEAEIQRNPRSRSAKLRVAERILI